MKACTSNCGDERPFRQALWLAAAAVFVLVAGGATSYAAGSKDKSVRLEDVGAEAFNAMGEEATGLVCASVCHGWEAIFGGPRRVPNHWDALVTDMIGRGANATEEQFDLIRRYLKWSWGMVWINSATADDLVAVLALSDKDAKAVISHRQEHGRFASRESLREVPGIDVAGIDARADAIMID